MKSAIIRLKEETFADLQSHLFTRYPDGEWACLLDCEWIEGVNDLVICVNGVLPQIEGDVSSGRGRVTINEPYSLRAALRASRGNHAVGLIHSHPENCGTYPSLIDDEMDDYFAVYFESFAPSRPYATLILSKSSSGEVSFSGRVFFQGQWYVCSHMQVTGMKTAKIFGQTYKKRQIPKEVRERLARVGGIEGEASINRLRNARVGLIGGGGTGSAAFHSLLRSCVGEIVVIDPDFLSPSNAERFHGFRNEYIDSPVAKVEALRAFAEQVNPWVKVTAILDDARSETAERRLAECDVILGCSDSQVGRLQAADFAMRYLIPALHVSVAMVAEGGRLVEEVIHITRYGPGLACPYCRDQVHAQRLAQELMTPTERRQRQEAAAAAPKWQKEQYWVTEPVIPTVGPLTTIAGELAARAASGMLTDTRKTPVSFLQLNLEDLEGGAISGPIARRIPCSCAGRDGSALAAPWIVRNVQEPEICARETAEV